MAPTSPRAKHRCRLQLRGANAEAIFTGVLILAALVIRFDGYTLIGLGPIDDHEIPMYAADPLQGWFASETFKPWLRWRPMFFSIRAFEASLWGTNAALWHWCRILEGTLSGALLSSSISRITSRPVAIIYGSLFCILAVHDEVIGKLGTSETYSLLGLSIWAVGASILLVSRQSSRGHSSSDVVNNIKGNHLGTTLLIVVGSILAAGSKEDMLLLMAPNLYFYIRACRYGLARTGRLAMAGVLAGQLMIALVVGYGLLMQGSDIYGESVGTSRIHSLQASLVGPTGYLLLFGVAYIVYRLILNRDLFDKLILISIFFILVLLSLPIYYGVKYPLDTFNMSVRYALAPQLILIAWASMALYDLCDGLKRNLAIHDPGSRTPVFWNFQVVAFAGGLLLWFTWAMTFAGKQFKQISITTKNLPTLIRASEEFQRGVTRAAFDIYAKNRTVVILATDPFQIENLVAAARYLHFLHRVPGKQIQYYYTPFIRNMLNKPLSQQEDLLIRHMDQRDFLIEHSVLNAEKYDPDGRLKPSVTCLFVGYSSEAPAKTPTLVPGVECAERIRTY